MSLATIVKGNTFSLAIPLQVYAAEDGEVVLRDYTPESGDNITIRLKGDRRNYTYIPSTNGSTAFIHLEGSEVVGMYAVEVEIVKDDDSKLTSMRFDQLSIVESIDELNEGQITEGIEQGAIYLDPEIFIAGKDGRGIVSIVKTATSGLVDTYTITYSDNTTSTFNVTNGKDGINGQDGKDGQDGVGIASITKTGTQGLVDTYTITMTNGTTYTYQVTNGKDGENGRDGTDGQDGTDGVGIVSITKTSTSGLVDTYTITYSDNTTSTFNVTNGAAGEAGATIASVEKTATVGKVDIYTITMTDGSTFDFEVTNGLDGVDLGLANIVDDLTTGGSTNVLSAEQGKVLGDGIFVIGEETTVPLTLEQGGFYGAEVPAKQGDKTPSTESVHPKRVRSADAIRVNGAFSASVPSSNLLFKFYYYNTNVIGHSSFNSSDAEWHTGTFNGNFDGYACILVKNSSNTNLLPSDVSAIVTFPPQLERRIEDSLESDATDMALSANQGKVLNEILFGADGENITLEQGTILTDDGTKSDTTSVQNKRVRTANFIKTNGTFTINISSGFVFKMFYYTSADTSTFESTDEWTDTNTYTGSYNGYVMFCIKKSDSTTITPSDVSATLAQLGIEQRLEDVEAVVPNPTTFEREYIGEVVRVGNNKFKQTAYKTLPMALSQAMAIYGDYILLFTYATSSATAYLYKLSDGTLLATLTLPNSTYKRPHCNAVSFGVTFNSANSILPLMYVSQWDNDSQKGCLVYDITLSGGTYSASLVQAILPTNVNTATRGAGQTDWVVDPNGYLYSIGYLLNDGAHTLPNNKTMIAKYKLPAISDGAEVVLGDADVLEHFDIPIFIYRQDAIFENGRILMLAGMTGAVDRRLLAIDPVAKQIVSLVSLDYINKEPEGLGVTDGKLLIGFNGDAVIYHFDFI